MVGRPATPGHLSGNDAIDAGQAGVPVGRDTSVQRILLEALHCENLDTCTLSIEVRLGVR
jgi:hypothetical protein